MHLSRRELIAALAALGVAPSAFARDDEPHFTFPHGIASGDQLETIERAPAEAIAKP